jgi:hypothetical protein
MSDGSMSGTKSTDNQRGSWKGSGHLMTGEKEAIQPCKIDAQYF